MNKEFENHVKTITTELELEDNVQIFIGERAYHYAESVNDKYLKEYNIPLVKNFKKSNGFYLWLADESVILLKKERVGTLAHEMRHAWQYKNKEEKGFEFELSKVIRTQRNQFKYVCSTKEFDANYYAFKYCMKDFRFINSLRYGWNIILSGFLRFFYKAD